MATAAGWGVALTLALAPSAAAYQPGPSDLYVAQTPTCNKRPCVLYPKSAQLPSGRIVAAFENSQGDPVGQTMPLYKSDDHGTTWQKLTDVKAPASVSGDPRFAKYTSNWTNPCLYVLPHDVGRLRAGTLLLASVVSGDDYYYKERKAADPDWQPSGNGDRKDVSIALYASTDDGANWSFENIIAAGGWQGGDGDAGRSAANTGKQQDPVWEPHLFARDGKLIAYYSDENEFTGYDATSGVPTLDPDNDTAPDPGLQILAHRTWDGTAASWSSPVVDVPGRTVWSGTKNLLGGGRPGMTTVVPTTDGKWLMTYEYWGGGSNVRYRVGDDPLRFHTAHDEAIGALPVPSGGRGLVTGGSPVLSALPDGRIVYNANGSGNVWVNESGRSTGTWKEYQTPVPAGYSRALQYVEGTGRLLVLQASWAGGSIGPVRYGEVDLGHSDGTYYTLVNRRTGQALTPRGGRTQDANLTGNVPDLITGPVSAADDTQRWHLTDRGGNVTLLNKAGGRAAGIWGGTATAGAELAQWVDDAAGDKQWTLVPSSDGYYKFRASGDSGLYMTGATADAAVDVRTPIDAATDPSADDAQEWRLVPEALHTGAPFVLKGDHSGRCLDVPDGAAGVRVQIWDCNGNANQTITQTGAGELRVAGKCLAAAGDGTAAGTELILWPCDGGSSQKWWFRLNGSVINRSNGLAIDVTNWGTGNGAPVQLWTPLGNATQTWHRV
ncbi:RICIN domain-containing protein [Streptomyces sp. OfavH-34-F]|uniref:RICIN domain-containing protein n=1 Tax=Streptomyces sp. OfavH-34-F TaxID=2917760 RepID=UPI001EF275B0|nr:RICIN domain-containing protein [Streptomyces sp. OfavH-34-F]MCG7523150.1 RICIN domain-containing protein [Streptomyces sp. OfavH-34-F]